MSLQGKVAIVTGGALGTLVAQVLANEGASIAYTYHSKLPESLEKLKTPLKAYKVDLRTEAPVKAFFEQVKKDFKRIDIAINCAGKVLKKPITDISESEYDEMFNVNTKAAFLFLKQAAINVEDGGKIVTLVTSLLAAFTGLYSVYAGSKAPVEHFTRAVAKELQPRRISVNAVAPGPMDTPFFYPAEEDAAVAFHKSQAMEGRLTKIEDIAPLVRFLVSDGQWITGQTIFINGGYTTR